MNCTSPKSSDVKESSALSLTDASYITSFGSQVYSFTAIFNQVSHCKNLHCWSDAWLNNEKTTFPLELTAQLKSHSVLSLYPHNEYNVRCYSLLQKVTPLASKPLRRRIRREVCITNCQTVNFTTQSYSVVEDLRRKKKSKVAYEQNRVIIW